MAKKFNEFQTEWKAIKRDVEKANEEINKNAQAIGQTSQIMKEGTKELGLRIQALKDGGATGQSFRDFLNDTEAKTIHKSIESCFSQIERELKRIDTLYKGDFKKTKDRFWNLKQTIKDEIDHRKKKKVAFIKIKSASLPDMESMLKDLNRYTDGAFANLDVFVPEDSAQHRKDLDRWIDAEFKQTRDLRLSKFQQEMDEQALSGRNLNKNLNKAKTCYEAILKECQKAQTALENRKHKDLMTAKADVTQLLKQLDATITPYDRALKDVWIKSQIKKSKDKATIENSIQTMLKLFEKAKDEIKKIANARL